MRSQSISSTHYETTSGILSRVHRSIQQNNKIKQNDTSHAAFTRNGAVEITIDLQGVLLRPLMKPSSATILFPLHADNVFVTIQSIEHTIRKYKETNEMYLHHSGREGFDNSVSSVEFVPEVLQI
ncbi:hypothetical protein HN011_001565 [Eciton burchellii]|nr:hypothetical protein HN011_001565 [Eciton burchellii]